MEIEEVSEGQVNADFNENGGTCNYVLVDNNLDVSKSLLGVRADSLDKLYDLYCRHAATVGFGVRKGTSRYLKGTNVVHEKYFLCSSEGRSRKEKNRSSINGVGVVAQRTRVETRTGCGAMIRIKYKHGCYEVIDHVIVHNHEIRRSGLSFHHECQSQSQTVDLKPELIDHMHPLKDRYNCARRLKTSGIDGGDARSMVNMLEEMEAEDEEFFFRVNLDDDGRLCNVFWRDSTMKEDFTVFGDVTVFDTTYRRNRYDLICAPFAGINHHRKNVMFGCAIMADEKVESFEWLFKTFRKSMGGLSPRSIFTDQHQAMSTAIDKVFPDATHRFCPWHVTQNAASRLGQLKNDSRFKKCVSGRVDEEEFLTCWNQMAEDYSLFHDPWFQRLFRTRHKWSATFHTDLFSAGILSSQTHKPTIDLGFDASKTTGISEFLKIVKSTVENWRNVELLDEFDCGRTTKPSSPVPSSGLVKHAFDVYTRELYDNFRLEFEKGVVAFDKVVSSTEDTCTYTVSLDPKFKNGHSVVYDLDDSCVSCSCKNFEECGWLCFHCLRIYHMFSVPRIPDRYILKRWTKLARSDVVGAQNGNVRWQLGTCRKYRDLASRAKGDEGGRKVMEGSHEHDFEAVENATGVLGSSPRKGRSEEEEIEHDLQRKKACVSTSASGLRDW